ncbi:MAG: bifunctional 2-polyprenyl-6-hydroxyphenol methylase/3-demethylubiquinol 3-O-methyltransferase UbiG [Gammaproteobacteria bacterium]|nr:bifunctional 2-polyprenyl-6-hydroxyphenol methylase/3-demethylubiquinol 3-O-methyltransferase UbiG [Gammaproteobacteria bacterium]MCH9744764.1 bifunctional 2-polyprenyl-6-hydroxyphenol methylase/3-demethylubiquinol 3-O-methyltransferase UbiG [Gammaproteobacteria bacterium]
MSVDPEEIAKFDQLADSWWDLDGDMKALHQLNPLRLGYIQKHTDLNNKTVLDLGCGAGILSEALAKQNAKVTAIDLSGAALSAAKQHAEKTALTIDYQQISAEALSQSKPNHFDLITCMEMLEHVPDPSAIIKSCAKLLKPGGYLFMSTINRNIKSFLGAVVAAEYVLQLLPRGTHEYSKFIRPSELHQWAAKENLNMIDLQGIQYHVRSGAFSYCNSVAINYLVGFQYGV